MLLTPASFSAGSPVEVQVISSEVSRSTWRHAVVAGRSCSGMYPVSLDLPSTSSSSSASVPGSVIMSVPASRMRPRHRPPRGRFRLYQPVEALCEGCEWRPGTVVRVRANGMFGVRVEGGDQPELDFSAAELRVPVEWVDGQWIQAQTHEMIRCERSEPLLCSHLESLRTGKSLMEGEEIKDDLNFLKFLLTKGKDMKVGRHGSEPREEKCRVRKLTDIESNRTIRRRRKSRRPRRINIELQPMLQLGGFKEKDYHSEQNLSFVDISSEGSERGGPAEKSIDKTIRGTCVKKTEEHFSNGDIQQRNKKECSLTLNEELTSPSSKCSTTYLPFVKTPSMWEFIESMEVFQRTPQQPHFRPLKQYDEMLREGMAIALMVTFSSLVDDIRKLKLDDSRPLFGIKLEALNDLESHGFNVDKLRTLLEDLIGIKENQEQLVEKQTALEGMILEKHKKAADISAQMKASDKSLNDLEQSLSDFLQKKTMSTRQMEHEQSSLLSLERDAKEIGDACQLIEHDFEKALLQFHAVN